MAPSHNFKQERIDAYLHSQSLSQHKARPDTTPTSRNTDPHRLPSSQANTNDALLPAFDTLSARNKSSFPVNAGSFSGDISAPFAGTGNSNNLSDTIQSSPRVQVHSPRPSDFDAVSHGVRDELSSSLSPIPNSSSLSLAPPKRALECTDRTENDRKRKSRSSSVSPLPIVLGERSSRQSTIISCLDQSETGIISSSLSSPSTNSYSASETGRETCLAVTSSQDDENSAAPLFLSDNEKDSNATESSLEDIDVATGIQNSPATRIPKAPQPYSHEHGSATTRPTRSAARSLKGDISTISSKFTASRRDSGPSSSYKYSLQKLIQCKELDQILQAQIAEVKETLVESSVGRIDSHTLPKDLRSEGSIQQDTREKSLLGSVVKDHNGEDDRVEKFMQAIKRISAPKQDDLWYFSTIGNEASHAYPLPFPSPSSTWPEVEALIFKSTASRDQLFLSGSAAHVLAKESLSLPHVKWIWEASILEPAEDLAIAYIEFLLSIAGNFQYCLDVDYLRGFLVARGVLPKALDLMQVVQTVEQPTATSDPQLLGRSYLPFLCRFLDIVTQSVWFLSISARSYLINLLFRLAADSFVAQDGGVQSNLRSCLIRLVDNIPEESRTLELFRACETIFSTVKGHALQLRVVTHIPTTNPTLNVWRTHLALSFFLGDSAILQRSFDGEIELEGLARMISNHIASDSLYPKSKFEDFPDFNALCASLSLLDAGISNGFSTDFRLSKSTISITKHSELRGFRFRESSSTGSYLVATNAHDSQIDLITRSIQTLNNSIADTGLSNTSRMDTKGVIERLLHRLEYSVRSRPRTKRDMLGQSSNRIETFFTSPKRDSRKLKANIELAGLNPAKGHASLNFDSLADETRLVGKEKSTKEENEDEQLPRIQQADCDDSKSVSGDETFYEFDDSSSVIKLSY